MESNRHVQVASMFLILLVGSLGLSSVYSPIRAASETPCGSCPPNVQVENVEVLEGEERNIAVALALGSQDYKNVKSALIGRGYTPLVNNSIAMRAKMVVNSTMLEVLAMGIIFSGVNKTMGLVAFIASDIKITAQAFIVDVENQVIRLLAKSENGELLFGDGVGTTSSYPCTEECLPGEICKCDGCGVYNIECLATCLSHCSTEGAWHCLLCFLTPNPVDCAICLFFALLCPFCQQLCCVEWVNCRCEPY